MQEVNEVYLLHSPAVDSIACIVEQGLNERFAGASAGSLFGAGLYFAENAGKTDQYATRMSGDSLHLHGLLNPEQSESAQQRWGEGVRGGNGREGKAAQQINHAEFPCRCRCPTRYIAATLTSSVLEGLVLRARVPCDPGKVRDNTE